jgi:hypothetical protein
MKKFIFTLFAICLLTSKLSAQKAWATPDPINPNDSITIWVDIKKCDRQQLAGTTDPLYMWTWTPKEHAKGHPLNNGTWQASNVALQMRSAGNDLYFYRMVPTQFYEVTAAELYNNDISLLLKKKDGTGGAAGEDKTEDLKIDLAPPVTGPQKISPFPRLAQKDTLSIVANDVLTIQYDRNLETKDTLKDKEDFYVFAKARIGAGAADFLQIVPITKVATAPQLAMKNMGNGKFALSMIPNKFFASVNPGGQKILSVQFQIVRGKIRNSNDTVDGTYEYFLNQNCE